MSSRPDAPVLLVLAGVNGAGKSSLGGVLIRSAGLSYFNPDEVAGRIRSATGYTMEEGNARAWEEGRWRLETAIEERSSYAFETTLGGRTMPSLIARAADAGFDVLMWFVGLSNPELHIARVRARVAAGGHDIPEEMIRRRWDMSRRNVIALMPRLAELRLFDNSKAGDPAAGTLPAPRLLLHVRRGRIVAPGVKTLQATPEWAKVIVAAASKLQRTGR
jgi:predicted ABC-type ATPase